MGAKRNRSRSPFRKNVNVLTNSVENEGHRYSSSTFCDSSVTNDTDTDGSPKFCNNSIFLFLNVCFNTLKVSALIDSGSSINIISEELFNSIPYS